MECTLALVGDGYTLVAADRNAARSIICFKKDEDKVTVLDSHKIMGSSGAIRRPAVPSRRRRDSSPGMMEVGRFLVDIDGNAPRRCPSGHGLFYGVRPEEHGALRD